MVAGAPPGGGGLRPLSLSLSLRRCPGPRQAHPQQAAPGPNQAPELFAFRDPPPAPPPPPPPPLGPRGLWAGLCGSGGGLCARVMLAAAGPPIWGGAKGCPVLVLLAERVGAEVAEPGGGLAAHVAVVPRAHPLPCKGRRGSVGGAGQMDPDVCADPGGPCVGGGRAPRPRRHLSGTSACLPGFVTCHGPDTSVSPPCLSPPGAPLPHLRAQRVSSGGPVPVPMAPAPAGPRLRG